MYVVVVDRLTVGVDHVMFTIFAHRGIIGGLYDSHPLIVLI